MDNVMQKPLRYQFTIFFMILLVTLAKYSISLGFSLKPYMIFLLLFIFFHLSSFYFQRLQSYEVAMLLFYFFYCYSGVFALHPDSSLRILLGITLYLMCYFIMKSILSYSNANVVEKGIATTGIIFNTASLILYVNGLRSANLEFEGERAIVFGVLLDRNYPRLIGLLEDPNFFVFYNTLFFAYYLCHPDSWKNRIGLLLCIATNLLTFSRGGMVALVIMFAIYLVLNKPVKQLKIVVGSLITLGLFVYVVTVQLKFGLLDMIDSRFEDFSYDGGSGRFELWERAWEFFSDNMFLGIGAFNFSDYNFFHHNDTLTVHNTFLDILSESGLVGISFYLIFIYLVFVQLWRFNVHRVRQYLFLTYIGFVLQMMFLSVIINDMFFLYIAILSTYLHSLQQEKEIKMPRYGNELNNPLNKQIS
ncbi:polysaccharide polymerase [Sutcliffiella horikoshii]|uniref:Polysaccharide polymerase n=1 Tax=Sutcliffiella horikoshii TaxID=79883 RepID=A0ABN4ZHU8_9BACI|nr:O-antigen ligase family protein [Sutcliffiella horikoshii]ART77770.1 polysaccharide polymerase [Sutcliffiella horikoshii]